LPAVLGGSTDVVPWRRRGRWRDAGGEGKRASSSDVYCDVDVLRWSIALCCDTRPLRIVEGGELGELRLGWQGSLLK